MSSSNIDLNQQIDFDLSIKPLIDEKKLEHVDKIKELQAEFNRLEEEMIQQRIEHENVEEEKREIRKKSSARLNYDYRSKESQDLVKEQSRLEQIEADQTEEHRSIEERLRELAENKRDYD